MLAVREIKQVLVEAARMIEVGQQNTNRNIIIIRETMDWVRGRRENRYRGGRIMWVQFCGFPELTD